MSFAPQPEAPKPSSDWITVSTIKVHKKEGYIIRISDGQPVPVYRKKSTGYIKCVLPKDTNIKGLGKGRHQLVSHVIVAALLGGFPVSNPVVIPKDGNKWNIRPSNLEIVSRQEAAYRKVMDNDVPLKLNGHIAMTLRDVVDRMVRDNVKDYDAIGSVFRISAVWTREVVDRKAWYYVEKFISAVTTKASDYQIHKVREAVAAYADYDKELTTHMAKGASA